jgi:hypothetical protein
MAEKQKERILNIIKQLGTLRYRDLVDHQIHPESLNRLVKSGKVIRAMEFKKIIKGLREFFCLISGDNSKANLPDSGAVPIIQRVKVYGKRLETSEPTTRAQEDCDRR